MQGLESLVEILTRQLVYYLEIQSASLRISL